MPRTYYNGTFSVTVNDDHSIRVRPGDWISKYSAAMYGDPLVHWDRFKRRGLTGQYYNLQDPNKIEAGELIYHPYALPEPGQAKPGKPIGVPQTPETPGTPIPADDVVSRRISDFFWWVKNQTFTPVTHWKFMDSQGGDLGVGAFAANYTKIQAQQRGAPQPTWFHAIGFGFGLGSKYILASGSISWPGDFSAGVVAQFRQSGPLLTAEEICGTYLLVDASAGYARGRSVAMMFFGLHQPVDIVLHKLDRFFRGEEDSISWFPSMFKGVIGMYGAAWSSPNAGLSIKVGMMHRKECVL